MIAVVSHDAGGAEILSSWLKRSKETYCLVLDGPAVGIFGRKIGNLQTHSLEVAIDMSDWVLCGTSWQSNLEKRAIIQAKAAGKKVIAFLDHWVNYLERFQFEGHTVYPDELWVGDVNAERIARKTFPSMKVCIYPNPYFADIQIEIQSMSRDLRNSAECSILYVCEPIREHALVAYGNERYWGYTEEDALRFFLENVALVGCAISEVTIRPHPSENKDKYVWAGQESSSVIETASTKTLMQQIIEADVVVGCESMAMVVALLARKRVISSIPPGGKVCSLPQPAIEHLQKIVSKHQGIIGG